MHAATARNHAQLPEDLSSDRDITRAIAGFWMQRVPIGGRPQHPAYPVGRCFLPAAVSVGAISVLALLPLHTA
jgi:hypothetical protein